MSVFYNPDTRFSPRDCGTPPLPDRPNPYARFYLTGALAAITAVAISCDYSKLVIGCLSLATFFTTYMALNPDKVTYTNPRQLTEAAKDLLTEILTEENLSRFSRSYKIRYNALVSSLKDHQNLEDAKDVLFQIYAKLNSSIVAPLTETEQSQSSNEPAVMGPPFQSSRLSVAADSTISSSRYSGSSSISSRPTPARTSTVPPTSQVPTTQYYDGTQSVVVIGKNGSYRGGLIGYDPVSGIATIRWREGRLITGKLASDPPISR